MVPVLMMGHIIVLMALFRLTSAGELEPVLAPYTLVYGSLSSLAIGYHAIPESTWTKVMKEQSDRDDGVLPLRVVDAKRDEQVKQVAFFYCAQTEMQYYLLALKPRSWINSRWKRGPFGIRCSENHWLVIAQGFGHIGNNQCSCVLRATSESITIPAGDSRCLDIGPSEQMMSSNRLVVWATGADSSGPQQDVMIPWIDAWQKQVGVVAPQPKYFARRNRVTALSVSIFDEHPQSTYRFCAGADAAANINFYVGPF